jgi:predicted MFS family arabinose efflux permease
MLMALGGLVFAGGLFALASAPSAAWALPALVVIGIGGATIGSLSAAALVARWFALRRGLALGFSAIGTSFGGVAMAPLTATLIEAFGWREALTVIAAAVAVMLVPLLYLVVRDHPADRDTHPDGALEPPPASSTDTSSLVLGDLVRDVRFWGIVAPIALTFGSFSGIMTNLVPLATDRGESLARAALLMSALAGCGVVGKLVFGGIADRVHPSRALATAIALALTGTLTLLAAETYAVLLAASAILGFSTGGMLPVWGTLIARAFGPLRFARVMGLMQPVMMPLSLASAPFAGFVRDSTGAYTAALQLYAAVFAVAVVLALFARTERGVTLDRTPR